MKIAIPMLSHPQPVALLPNLDVVKNLIGTSAWPVRVPEDFQLLFRNDGQMLGEVARSDERETSDLRQAFGGKM